MISPATSRLVMTLVLLLCGNAATGAATISLTPANVGLYIGQTHVPDGFAVSSFNGLGFEARSYLVFDVSNLLGTVLSVDLQANSGGDPGRSDDVEIAFRSFPGAVADLTDGTADFDDLINGSDYATFTALATFPDETDFTVSLNATAVADINSSGNLFVITVVQPVATPSSGFLADVTASQFSLLVNVSAIPEPSILATLSVSGLLACLRRRRLSEVSM